MRLTGPECERGSLPIAMLAALVLGSVVTVLVATVITTERHTRFDQGFEQALEVAEVGLARLVHLVKSEVCTDSFSLVDQGAASPCASPSDPATIGVPAGRYEGVADRVGNEWRLTATGTAPDGTTRTVAMVVRQRSVFDVAAFGRTRVALRGDNSADSFRSGSFDQAGTFTSLHGGSDICHNGTAADPFSTSDASGTRMCNPTGNGVVATNEEMFLLGQVIEQVDRAEIHYAREQIPDPLPGATGFCSGVAQTCASGKLHYFRDPLELEPDPVLIPDDLVNQGSFAGPVLPKGPQLYTNVRLDSDTRVEGTPEQPSVVYLTGTLTVPNQAVVNFESIGGRWVPASPAGLLVFSAGSGPALRFGNHASFSGAVYAPRAVFGGGAAGNLYGSIVSSAIDTRGSWNFHYDDALGEVTTQAVRETDEWTER